MRLILKVGFISLGCSKNLIDTEILIGHFKNHKYQIENNPEKAEIIIINTCGFIESAKEEEINTILEMAEYKKQKCKYLIVMGCLVQRYYDELIKELPEVDLFVKIDEYDCIWRKIEKLIEHNILEISTTNTSKKITEIKPLPMPTSKEFNERVITTGENYAYLKIGEGCSNRCTYCAIPYIRGPFVSRPEEDIIEEAKILASKGIKELIVIAQDTTKYGVDLYGEPKLAELLQKLSTIPEIKWIRFLYTYPEGITDELIKTVKENEKICKYFDIPIQHISDTILKRMNRRTNKNQIEELIQKLRKEIPNVILRTSLIVGFPGETNQDFEELYEFVQKTKFDKLGTFMYSKEDGTPAAKLLGQISKKIKKDRYNKIMEVQQKISNEVLKSKIGQKYEVLIENMSFDEKYLIGRTKQDVPDIDGIIYIKNNENKNLINQIVNCIVTDVNDYDLIGEIC